MTTNDIYRWAGGTLQLLGTLAFLVIVIVRLAAGQVDDDWRSTILTGSAVMLLVGTNLKIGARLLRILEQRVPVPEPLAQPAVAPDLIKQVRANAYIEGVRDRLKRPGRPGVRRRA